MIFIIWGLRSNSLSAWQRQASMPGKLQAPHPHAGPFVPVPATGGYRPRERPGAVKSDMKGKTDGIGIVRAANWCCRCWHSLPLSLLLLPHCICWCEPSNLFMPPPDRRIPPLPFSHSHQPGPPSSLHPFYLSFATVSGSFDAHAGCRLPCTDPSLVTLLWMLSPSPSPRLQPSQLRVRSRWGARKEQRHSLGRLSPSRDTIVDWNGGKWKEWGDQKCHLTLRQR